MPAFPEERWVLPKIWLDSINLRRYKISGDGFICEYKLESSYFQFLKKEFEKIYIKYIFYENIFAKSSFFVWNDDIYRDKSWRMLVGF